MFFSRTQHSVAGEIRTLESSTLPLTTALHLPKYGSLNNVKFRFQFEKFRLFFDLSFHLHPYLVHAGSAGSGETVRMRRFAGVLAARKCDK